MEPGAANQNGVHIKETKNVVAARKQNRVRTSPFAFSTGAMTSTCFSEHQVFRTSLGGEYGAVRSIASLENSSAVRMNRLHRLILSKLDLPKPPSSIFPFASADRRGLAKFGRAPGETAWRGARSSAVPMGRSSFRCLCGELLSAQPPAGLADGLAGA